MREIKFRGKDSSAFENTGWVYGFFALRDVPYVNTEFTRRIGIVECPYIILNEEGKEPKWIPVPPKTVGQYTGKKDKDGHEIYEGDIVMDHSDPMGTGDVGVVVYDADRAMFAIRYYGGTDESITYGMYDCKQNELEVIGNIHDNPELLKE